MPQLQQKKKKLRPKQQQQRQPGLEHRMTPAPEFQIKVGASEFAGKVILITGGDSGIGRATALAFAAHGSRVAILYLNEKKDAEETLRLIQEVGGEGIAIAGDIGEEAFCRKAVKKVIKAFGQLDVLINNAAEQHPQKDIEDITAHQLERTFRTNLFSYFYMVKAALSHLKEGSCIINTTSVTAYRGSASLLDYSATKGAIVSFTRSLAHSLVKRGIRVNAVAPGPVWTPLIPATFPDEKVETFGSDVPMGRTGQPNEIAPCYTFLASAGASYMTGQVLHPNGGEIING